MSSSTELAGCRATLKGGSRSFHLAAGLLPPRVRGPASVLYAFCREADDLVDDGGGAAAVAQLYRRLGAMADHRRWPDLLPRDLLLAEVLDRHQVPPGVLGGLLEGFAWDVEGRQYQDIEPLLAYAMRVAGTVGLAMARVMGVRGRRPLMAATALGIAMQLTNICRDVGEDARLGRLYLPQAWLQEADIDPQAWLRAPESSAGLVEVVDRLLALADAFYAVGDAGLAMLPADCRTGIRAARRLYAEIGHALRRRGGDPLAGRTVVGLAGKLACLVRSSSPRVDSARILGAEAACERVMAPFLADFPATVLNAPGSDNADLGRLVWMFDLFERLERRSIALRSGGADAQA